MAWNRTNFIAINGNHFNDQGVDDMHLNSFEWNVTIGGRWVMRCGGEIFILAASAKNYIADCFMDSERKRTADSWELTWRLRTLLTSGMWRRVVWQQFVDVVEKYVPPSSMHNYSFTLKTATVCPNETLLRSYQTTRRHIVEVGVLLTSYLCLCRSMINP